MNKLSRYDLFAIGMMIFAMTFGAGNAMYPLLTGFQAGSAWLLASMGFLLASAILPAMGFLAVMLFKGEYGNFLNNSAGKHLAFSITLISMLLLGPLGCIPRCVIFAATTLNLETFWFKSLFTGVCILLASKKSNLINILGKIIGPITVLCLIILIIVGLVKTPAIVNSSTIPCCLVFWNSFKNGCLTFDLLAMVFYSRVIYEVVAEKQNGSSSSHQKTLSSLKKALAWSTIAFFSIYSGMILIASKFGASLSQNLLAPMLFSKYAQVILGEKFAFIQSIIISLACFSTTNALLTVFADYLAVDIFKKKISYQSSLLITGATAFVLANYSFANITSIMVTLIKFAYPFLIIFVFLAPIKKLYFKDI